MKQPEEQIGTALLLSHEDLRGMVEVKLEAMLPEVLRRMAEEKVRERIGMLDFTEARKHLRCRNDRQLLDLCKRKGIPVHTLTSKKRFLRLADIEEALVRSGELVGGTEIGAEGRAA